MPTQYGWYVRIQRLAHTVYRIRIVKMYNLMMNVYDIYALKPTLLWGETNGLRNWIRQLKLDYNVSFPILSRHFGRVNQHTHNIILLIFSVCVFRRQSGCCIISLYCNHTGSLPLTTHKVIARIQNIPIVNRKREMKLTAESTIKVIKYSTDLSP